MELLSVKIRLALVWALVGTLALSPSMFGGLATAGEKKTLNVGPSGAAADSQINQAAAASNYGSATTATVMGLGTSSAANFVANRRYVLQMETPTALTAATTSIKTGRLSLYAGTTATTPQTHGLYSIGNPAWTNASATWSLLSGATATLLGTVSTPTSPGFVTWTVPGSTVAGWLATNNGLLVRDLNEATVFGPQESSKVAWNAGSTLVTTISNQPNQTYIAAVTTKNGDVTATVASGGPNWTLVGTSYDSTGSSSKRVTMFRYDSGSVANGSLNVTASLSAIPVNASMVVVRIAGVATGTPAVTAPAPQTTSSSTPTATISTANPNAIVVWAVGTDSNTTKQLSLSATNTTGTPIEVTFTPGKNLGGVKKDTTTYFNAVRAGDPAALTVSTGMNNADTWAVVAAVLNPIPGVAYNTDNNASSRPALDIYYMRTPSVTSSTTTANSLTLNYQLPTPASGTACDYYSGVIGVMRAGGTPTAAPTDNAALPALNTVNGSDVWVARVNGTGASPAPNCATTQLKIENGPFYSVLPSTSYTVNLFSHDASAANTILGATGPSYSPVASYTFTTPAAPDPSVSPAWTFKSANVTLAPPTLVTGGFVVAGDGGGNVYMVRVADGSAVYAPSSATGKGYAGNPVQGQPSALPAAMSSTGTAQVYVVSGDGTLFAFNSDGTQRANSAAQGNSFAGPAGIVGKYANNAYKALYSDDTLFTCTNVAGGANKIVAFGSTSLAVRWSHQPSVTDAKQMGGCMSKPSVDSYNNVVWVSTASFAGGPSLWKFDALNGNLLAAYTLGGEDVLKAAMPNSFAPYSYRFIFVVTSSGKLYAIDGNGAGTAADIVGPVALAGTPTAFPLVASNGIMDQVFVATSAGVYRRDFNRATRVFSTVWDKPGIVAGPSAPLGTNYPSPLGLYVSGTDGKVYKLDAATGSLWGTGPSSFTVSTSALGDLSMDSTNNLIFVGDTNGYLYRIPKF